MCRIRHLVQSALVKAPSLQLHGLHLFANGIQAERPHQPHGPAVDEALHVLPADERDMVAESLAVHVNQGWRWRDSSACISSKIFAVEG